MTRVELKAEALRRLGRDHGITGAHPRVCVDHAEDLTSWECRNTMNLDNRPFVSWTNAIGYEDHVQNVVWHFDEIGQPDLSFKGINKFKGRWEGENA